MQELIDDTVIEVGSEAFTAALVAYRYAKDSGLGAGPNGVIDDFGRRLARKSKESGRTTKGLSRSSDGQV
jgi:hypothetical protein